MTLINLLCHLPNFAGSLFVVALLASALSWTFSGAIVAVWLVSGALVFHRPTERTLARRQLRLRRPTPRERARLEPIWHLVTARAGVAAHTYELWVEDSDDINAVAAEPGDRLCFQNGPGPLARRIHAEMARPAGRPGGRPGGAVSHGNGTRLPSRRARTL